MQPAAPARSTRTPNSSASPCASLCPPSIIHRAPPTRTTWTATRASACSWASWAWRAPRWACTWCTVREGGAAAALRGAEGGLRGCIGGPRLALTGRLISSCSRPPSQTHPATQAGGDLTSNGMSAGAAAAALTFAVPAGRMLATERSRRRLGNRLSVSVVCGRGGRRHGRGAAWPLARLLPPTQASSRLPHRRPLPCNAMPQGVFDGVGRLFDFRGGFKLSSALYAGGCGCAGRGLGAGTGG